MRVVKKIWWLPLAVYMIVIPSFMSDRVFMETCSRIDVNIIDSASYRFVTGEFLLSMVQNETDHVLGNPLSGIDIDAVEREMKSIRELESVEVYSTADGVLHIYADQRDPQVRIMTSFGNSYYLDKHGVIIPHSNNYSPRIIVVSGNISVPDKSISEGNINSLPESSMIKEIMGMVNLINSSDLWSDQIEQIWVTENGNIELVPRVGNHIIKIGKPDNFESKLGSLETLYNEAMPMAGWNRYKEINLMYEGQIVCKKDN